MSDSKNIMTLDEWADQFSIEVAQEIYRTLDNIEKEKRGQLHRKLPLAFITRFIAFTILQALKERPDHIKTNKDAYKYTMANYNSMKLELQNGIAAAFAAAMETFSGKEVEYMCQIKVMPEPLNKKPC